MSDAMGGKAGELKDKMESKFKDIFDLHRVNAHQA